MFRGRLGGHLEDNLKFLLKILFFTLAGAGVGLLLLLPVLFAAGAVIIIQKGFVVVGALLGLASVLCALGLTITVERLPNDLGPRW